MAETAAVTNQSCWTGSAAERPSLPPLSGNDLRTDVAIVGGGLIGITTALLLQRAGRSVALLEAGRLGRQVTGGSTAKITSQHGLIYHFLAEKMGDDAAATYARSNQAALEWICAQVREQAIDCDLERCPAYVYTTSEARLSELEREAEVASRLGLPARLEHEVPLPFRARAAVRFDEQAQFHPVKYLDALGRELTEQGAHVYESTRVIDVESGNPCRIVTEAGSLTADDVVVATNLPILDRGGFFGRAFPYRHMCLAAPVGKDMAPSGMFISVDAPTRSVRSTPWNDEERLLIVIGEAFPTGHGDNATLLDQLEQFARQHFDVASIAYRWGNQDYYSVDRVPYVGQILPGSTPIRIATGFNAWGITTGTAAAMVLADEILGRPNDWASLYQSNRLSLRVGGRKLLQKNLGVAQSWIAERILPSERQPAESLAPGEGGIVQHGGDSVAAFRDEDGTLHSLAPHCTHMGCELRWNSTERSWDCHCHGSRFDVKGRALNGPAVRNLQQIGGYPDGVGGGADNGRNDS